MATSSGEQLLLNGYGVCRLSLHPIAKISEKGKKKQDQYGLYWNFARLLTIYQKKYHKTMNDITFPKNVIIRN